MAPAPVDGSGPERERICVALIEAVAARGYRSTGVDHVTERAGVDQAAFSRHFEGLEDCFAAAWEGVDAELTSGMSAAYGRRGDWQDRLRDALSAGLEFLGSDDDRARVYVAEALYVSERMRDRQRRALARLSSTIDLGRDAAAGSGGRAPPGVADAVSGAIWHRVQQLVQTGRSAELPGEVSRFMYMAVLPYRGAGPAEAELGRT